MTVIKETRRKYSLEFKQETVALVTQQGYTVSQAAEVVNINPGTALEAGAGTGGKWYPPR